MGSVENPAKRIPLEREIGVLKCNSCKKQILESAFKHHLDICGKPLPKPKQLEPIKIQLPNVEKIKEEKSIVLKKVKKKHVGPAINLDIHCGVPLDLGGICSRSISCKVHSVPLKRKVEGRSTSYDILYQEHMTRLHSQKKSNYFN